MLINRFKEFIRTYIINRIVIKGVHIPIVSSYIEGYRRHRYVYNDISIIKLILVIMINLLPVFLNTLLILFNKSFRFILTLNGMFLIYRPSDLQMYTEIFMDSSYDVIRLCGQSKCKRKPYIIIDCGSHIGIYILKVSRIASKIVAIEPEPNNIMLLQCNLNLNRIKAFIVPWALSSTFGKAKFYLSSENGFRHSLKKDKTMRFYKYLSDKYIEIKTVPLDLLLPIILRDLKQGKILVMKIDVEGAELDVLRGARRLFNIIREKDIKTLIIMEVHSKELLNEVINVLKYYGFHVEPYKLYKLYKYLVAYNYQIK